MLHSNSKNKRNAVLKYAQLRLGEKKSSLFFFQLPTFAEHGNFSSSIPIFILMLFSMLREATRQLLILTFWFAQGHFNRSSIVSACFQRARRDFDITDKRMGWALDKKERKKKEVSKKPRLLLLCFCRICSALLSTFLLLYSRRDSFQPPFRISKRNKAMATKTGANTGMYRNFVSPQIKDEKKLVAW